MMSFSFFVFSYFIIVFGMLFILLFFYIHSKKKYFALSKQYINYKHAFQAIVKDLEREVGVRKNIEERLKNDEDTLKKLYVKLALTEERLDASLLYCKKYDSLKGELRLQKDINIAQEVEMKQMVFCLKEKSCEVLEKERLLFDFEKKFSEKFEILANRVFEYNGEKISTQNKLSLDMLLDPLRLQLDSFSQDVTRKFSREECERHTLIHELHNLQRLNAQMSKEAVNLTNALKGNNKVQGNWGEIVLKRILEESGMREGYEFHTQSNIKLEDGRRLQPDVIVHFPNGRDVIIDSKTSLLSYEQYFNASSDSKRKIFLSNYITSLRTHIKLLAKKDYQSLYTEVKILDYVLMFVPIESAFMLALNEEISLLSEGMEYNIMLVSPTTLVFVLRIINNLWRYEYQNRYTEEIADGASRLYDKFRLFIDDINGLGQYLGKLQNSYSLARNKLFEGSGNLVSQAEKFRFLGVNIKRPILSKKKSSTSFQSFSLEKVTPHVVSKY